MIGPSPITAPRHNTVSPLTKEPSGAIPTLHAIPPFLTRSRRGNVAFELICEHLPSFDTSKTLKTMFLSESNIQKFNRVKTRGRFVFPLMLQIGNVLMLLTTIAPARIGVIMAVVAPVLQLPGVVIIVASVRVQMIRILLTTYDFWFLTVSNVIFCVCFAVLLRDLRITTLLFGCAIAQISVCADAQVGNAHQLLTASIVNMVTHAAMLLAVLFRLVETSSTHVAFFWYSSDGHSISTRELLMNAQFNMVVLFSKLVYRNWRITRERKRERRQLSSHTVLIPEHRTCVSYQCSLKLVRKATVTSMSSTRLFLRRSAVHPRPLTGNDVVQLEFVPIMEEFNEHDSVIPRWSEAMKLVLNNRRHGHRRVVLLAFLYALGLLGFVCSVVAGLMGWFLVSASGNCLEVSALISSSTFCAIFLVSYQRQLCSRLIWSFDFIFLSSQLTITSCCLSSFFAWDKRAFSVWSFWLWMHWALTLDALTPSTSVALGFKRAFATPVIVLLLIMQFLFALQIIYWNCLWIPTQDLFQVTIIGRDITVKMVPFFLTRVWFIFMWNCRLLWRDLRRKSDDERLVLRGNVEFHFHWRKRNKPGHPSSLLQRRRVYPRWLIAKPPTI